MVVMKALLLLSVLLLSAGISKAQDGMSPKEAYFYGNIIGVGSLLCTQAESGDISNDIARSYFKYWVSETRKQPSASDVIRAIDLGYKNMTEDPECKYLFGQ